MKVYQIPTNNYRADDVRCDLMLRGSKEWKTEYFDLFLHVANVATDDMNEVFEVMNLWNNDEIIEVVGSKVRSLSVGDIIMKDDKTFWMVDSCGFTEVK